MTGKAETQPWDVVDHLKSEEDMIAYLDAALEDGDPALIVAALGDIARAKGMTEVAQFFVHRGPTPPSLPWAFCWAGRWLRRLDQARRSLNLFLIPTDKR